jgi:hypothetical protein
MAILKQKAVKFATFAAKAVFSFCSKGCKFF